MATRKIPDEIHETTEGTIRSPTATSGSFLELSIAGAVVSKRFVDEKGRPHGDHSGNWRQLPAHEILSYYTWPQLRAWFRKHGLTEAMLREREVVEEAAKRGWKKKR